MGGGGSRGDHGVGVFGGGFYSREGAKGTRGCGGGTRLRPPPEANVCEALEGGPRSLMSFSPRGVMALGAFFLSGCFLLGFARRSEPSFPVVHARVAPL